MCPGCRRPVADCSCGQPAKPPAGDGIVRVSRATQGRSGKGVTLVSGLPLAPAELAALAKQLKALCGCGGTVEAGLIELQGEHRDKLVAHLQKAGWTVKRAGG